MSERTTDSELWSLVDDGGPPLQAHLECHPEDAARVAELGRVLGGLARPEVAPMPERIGPYAITGVLGRGGSGVVYSARQPRPERAVAVKVLHAAFAADQGARERFRREAQALAQLAHPGVAAVHEAGETAQGEPYLVLELVRGAPITVHAERGRLSRRARCELFVRVCDAVEHAHLRGVLHRDLKPANVLVGADGAPKVLDFGLARLSEGVAPGLTRASAERVLGTLGYASPEQVSGGDRELDARADVYGLGATLYELLTGRLPHDLDGLSLHAALRKVAERELVPARRRARTLRGDLDAILGKALAFDRRRRYASAAELADDLRRHLAGRPVLARPPTRGYRARRFARRHPLALGLSALCAGLFAAALWSGTLRFTVLEHLPVTWGSNAPFEALRWRGDVPEVRLDGRWWELLAIDGLVAPYVVGYCKQEFGAGWRKRFSEDLQPVLHRMGSLALWSVDLELREVEGGASRRVRGARLRPELRHEIWKDRHEWPFHRWRWSEGTVRVALDGREWELLSVDGCTPAELERKARELGVGHASLHGLYDLLCELRGRSPGERVPLELADLESGERRSLVAARGQAGQGERRR